MRIWSAELPGTLAGWRHLPANYIGTNGGIAYSDPAGLVAGIDKLRMSQKTPFPPAPDRQKFKITAQGASLALPPVFSTEEMFDQVPAIVFQLVKSNGRCWDTSFTAADTKKNRPDSFGGKIR